MTTPAGQDAPQVECTLVVCNHRMFSRCPGCKAEMYAVAVWGFSHGAVQHSCGYRVTPEVYLRVPR